MDSDVITNPRPVSEYTPGVKWSEEYMGKSRMLLQE